MAQWNVGTPCIYLYIYFISYIYSTLHHNSSKSQNFSTNHDESDPMFEGLWSPIDDSGNEHLCCFELFRNMGDGSAEEWAEIWLNGCPDGWVGGLMPTPGPGAPGAPG